MPELIKKILLVYISIVLTFAPSSVFAASPSGWSFSAFDAATSVVTAMKNGASASVAVAKSPISQKIAKGIVGGAIAGAALPLAISQISGIALEAVDWVLDPANNQIKYTPKADASLVWYIQNTSISNMSTPQSACQAYYNGYKTKVVPNGSSGTSYLCYYTNVESPKDYEWYGGLGINSKKPQAGVIPIPTVADKIYDNAKTDAASASVVNQAVKEYVNEGYADVALDTAKADADATHNCGTGTHWSGSACVADIPTTPTTPTTPDIPFDPSSIIDAIEGVFDAVMSLPDVINSALDSLLADIKDFFQPVVDSVTDMIDWFKSDPDPQTDNTKPDIDTRQPTKSATDFDTDYLRFGGQCPNFSPTTISVGIVAVPISFDAQPLCDFAILCRPIILALAYFVAMAIVANAIRSE